MKRGTLAIDQDEARAERVGEQVLENIDTDPRAGFHEEIGAYMASLRRYPVLKDAEVFDRMYRQYQGGATEDERREARDLIVYGNIRLVLSIALRHTGRGLPLLDMLQEGVLGVMHALEMYDHTKGFRFSTYATWWIRQAITRAIVDQNEDHPVRIPVHYAEQLNLIRRIMAELLREHGSWPDDLQIFEKIRASGTDIGQKMRLSDVVRLHRALVKGGFSLDEEIILDEGGTVTIGDTFVADNSVDIETTVEAKRLLGEYRAAFEKIEGALTELDPRSAMVIRLRLGLGDFEPMTLEEVGERYGVTRERIRQIEVKALAQLETKLGVAAGQIVELTGVIEELARIVAAGEPSSG